MRPLFIHSLVHTNTWEKCENTLDSRGRKKGTGRFQNSPYAFCKQDTERKLLSNQVNTEEGNTVDKAC
jgi:hypothetical protein